MQTNATTKQAGSPVPGVIPEPVRVRDDVPAPARRPPSGAWARILSVLHPS
jgi:hypothetical protein